MQSLNLSSRVFLPKEKEPAACKEEVLWADQKWEMTLWKVKNWDKEYHKGRKSTSIMLTLTTMAQAIQITTLTLLLTDLSRESLHLRPRIPKTQE